MRNLTASLARLEAAMCRVEPLSNSEQILSTSISKEYNEMSYRDNNMTENKWNNKR